MKLVKIVFCCLFLSFLFVNQTVAQEHNEYENNSEQIEKESYLFWGGSLWLSFGSYTYVDANLVLGSQITDRLSLGVSGKYQYYNDKRSIDGNFKSNVFGGSVFTQFAIIKDFRNIINVKGHSGIISHIEYEFLNTEYNYFYFNDPVIHYDRYWLHNILIGGGYFQRIGMGSMSYVILLWNVNKVRNNPYVYPQLRIGFSFTI